MHSIYTFIKRDKQDYSYLWGMVSSVSGAGVLHCDLVYCVYLPSLT